MEPQRFFKRLESIQDIPTLPAVALKVNRMLQDNETSIELVSRTIEKDQAIVSKLLKLVNSSFFGFQSKIDTVSRAIVILGFNCVRNAIISISVMEAFRDTPSAAGFDISQFWRHSLSVAITARHLAEKSGLESPDESFTTSLLHDLGKVVLARFFEDTFHSILTVMRSEGLSFHEAEKRILPIDHARIGGYLARRWRLPQEMVDAITYHHGIDERASNFNLLAVLHAADSIVNHREEIWTNSSEADKIDQRAQNLMKGQLETIAQWFRKVCEDIDDACNFFLSN